jgi:5'-3' exonuclease
MKYLIDASEIGYMSLFVSGITEDNCLIEENHGLFYKVFINKINTWLKTLSGKDIWIVWDSKTGKNWRKSIYPAYNANRRKTESNLMTTYFKILLPTLKEEILKYFPVNSIEHELAEADDIIYSLCNYFNKEDEITVFSGDGDLTQLLLYFDNVKVYCPRKKKYQKKPDKDFVKLKAIIGDKSDNIIGVYRLGPKSAPDYISGKKIFSEKQQEEYDKCLKIVDLTKFPYQKEVIEKIEETKTNKFNPDLIELFIIENNMEELNKRWGTIKNDINKLLGE